MPPWIYIRYIKLPVPVKAITVPNADDTFCIFINSSLNGVTQRKALDHELAHIKLCHHYDNRDVATIEKEAG